MERNYRTWQGRLPQELRRAQIQTLTEANQFLRQGYLAEFNRQFAVPASQPGSAFMPCRRRDLDWVFSLQYERTVNQVNTVLLERRVLQISRTRWRHSLAGCVVTVHQHRDGGISIRYGPHLVGLWSADQLPLPAPKQSRPARLPVGTAPAPQFSIGQPVHPSRLPCGSLRSALTGPARAGRQR
jgi:hypothetical protein